MQNNHMYIAIDLKTFYASVECVERNLDPLDTNLVVADPQRTEKTICLAVSPSLKAFGISGRARLFEVVQKVKVNDVLAVIEAMKMETSVVARMDGTIDEVFVKGGQTVKAGELLLTIK